MMILVKRFLAPMTWTDLRWEVPSLPELHFLTMMIRIIAIVESDKCLSLPIKIPMQNLVNIYLR